VTERERERERGREREREGERGRGRERDRAFVAIHHFFIPVEARSGAAIIKKHWMQRQLADGYGGRCEYKKV
jgi:hypothetical protein